VRPVSIRAPTRGATIMIGTLMFGTGVSIRAPTRGATNRTARILGNGCFNPRAHAGRDSQPAGHVQEIQTFQSARPRGARRMSRTNRHDRGTVSIRAPTRGATHPQRLHLHRCGVSIRAPTRGATSRTPKHRSVRTSFNPRAHAGRDLPTVLPWRSRYCFNPRAHAGRDPRDGLRRDDAGLFQSARPRGARPARAR